jgi:replicative DNA helicase
MLLSKDAVADVIEVLRGNDFYRPAHETIYEAILDLYGRGEPADAVTVSAELTKRGELGQIGGPRLPAHAHLVGADRGQRRVLRTHRPRARGAAAARHGGTRIVQLGYATDGGDVDEIVNAAQAEVYQVTERRTSEDYLPLSEIIEGTIDEIEASSHRGDGLTGIPSGFADLDRLTNGFHGGQMIVIAARPAVGKALALNTPVPTPYGWTTMGAVRVGDEVLGSDGRPTRVVAATEVMIGRPCYEVHFSDGSVLVADEQHQWLTETRASRRSAHQAKTGYNRYKNQRTFAEVRTTAEIARTLRCGTADGRLNHSVRLAPALDLPEADLPVPPYTLGAWLGDGTSAAAQITSYDPEVLVRIEADGFVVVPHANHRYSLRLPQEPVARRTCVVCGSWFVPRTSQVRTCGRRAGARRAWCRPPCPRPPARTVVAPRAACVGARRATTRTGLCRDACAASGSSTTSTFPGATFGPPSHSAGTCWPGCSTPTGPLRRPAPCRSLSRTACSPSGSASW